MIIHQLIMKSFFAALFTVLLIASCSDSPTNNDGFQPVRYGNFLQVSEARLDWIGNGPAKTTAQTSAQGDTTFFAAPDGNALRIEYAALNDRNDAFAVVYTDSSYSFAYFDSTSAASEAHFVNPFATEYVSSSIGISENLVQLSVGITNFSCDSTYNFSEEDDFEFHILDDSGETYESIIVDSDGIEQALRAVGC